MSRAGGTPTVRVRVQPRARANVLTRAPDGTLRARLTAPPVEGAANRGLVELLARELGLKRGALAIVQGTHHREKVVAVEGVSAADLALRIAALAASDVDKAGRRG